MLTHEGLGLLEYLKTNAFCTYYDALRVLIPAGLGLDLRVCYQLAPAPDETDEAALTEQEQAVVDLLHKKRQPVEQGALCKAFGLDSPALFESLCNRGVLARSEEMRQKVQDEKLTMVRLCEEQEKRGTPPKSARPSSGRSFLFCRRSAARRSRRSATLRRSPARWSIRWWRPARRSTTSRRCTATPMPGRAGRARRRKFSSRRASRRSMNSCWP